MAQLDWYLQVNLKARHLRLLVALDDFGNLKQVAEISHVTVPAVSKALAELDQNRLAEAEGFLNQAQMMAPENADVPQLLGYIRRAQGRLAEAEDLYRRSLELKPDQPALQDARRRPRDRAGRHVQLAGSSPGQRGAGADPGRRCR